MQLILVGGFLLFLLAVFLNVIRDSMPFSKRRLTELVRILCLFLFAMSVIWSLWTMFLYWSPK